MGAHYRRAEAGTEAERPTFDEVARGYDPRQVQEYVGALLRYANQVTAQAAAAEAALAGERRRRDGEALLPDNLSAQAGGRIGLMLAIAQQEADDIVAGARTIAERALEEAIEDAAANHPIVRKAREQAEKLLLDAVEESRQRAQQRHDDIETRIVAASGTLETLRRHQGEILGALLRLRSLINTDEIDRAATDLARSGSGPDPSTVRNFEPERERDAGGAGSSSPLFAEAPGAAPAPSPRQHAEDDIIDAEIVEEASPE